MGAVPETETQLKTLITNCVNLYEQARMFGSVNSGGGGPPARSNVVSLQSAIDGALVGTQLAQTAADIVATRTNLVAFLRSSRNTLQNLFVEYGKLLNYRGTTFGVQWLNVFREYSENSKYIASRGFVFGTPAGAGGNIGNGAINQLVIDRYGNVIENTTTEAKIARCVADANSGAPLQEEVFSIEGAAAGRDAIEEYGSGAFVGNVKGLSANTSTRYGLKNPSFSTSTPTPQTTAPTDLGGWTSTSTLGGATLTVNGTNYQVRTDSPYRAYQGDTTPAYLRVLAAAASFCISQNLEANGANFLDNVPYYFHIAVRRQSSATGTLTLRIGAASVSVDLSTLTNNVWVLLKIAVTKSTWFKVFGDIAATSTVPQVTLSIECPNLTTGNVDIDDVTIGPYTQVDGLWYAPVGGSTPFAFEDKFTWTTAEYGATSAAPQGFYGINQKWLWRGPGVYLPSVPAIGTATLTLADGGAGALSVGTYKYVITFVDVNGIESGPSTLQSIALAASHQTSISAISAGNTSIAKRKVYRTVAGGSTYFLLPNGTISDNVTTTLTDNNSDASLAGAASPPVGITFADPT